MSVSLLGNSGSNYSENLVTFDGTNDYLQWASLTGAADGTKAFAFAAVAFAAASGLEYFVCQGTGADDFSLLRRTTGEILVRAASDAVFIDSISTVGAQRVNVLASVDTAATSRLYFQVGGTWAAGETEAAAGGGDIDLTGVWNIGARGGFNKFNGNIARMALWIGIAPDITDAAVRNLFTNADGTLADPALSVAEYGQAIIDCYGPAAIWNAGTNYGSGGDGTMNGAVTDA